MNRTVRGTTSAWKALDQGPQQKYVEGVAPAPAYQQRNLRPCQDSTNSKALPVVDEDGFTMVKGSAKDSNPGSRSNNRQTPIGKAQTISIRPGPPSVAAFHRESIYASRGIAPSRGAALSRGTALSGYKQSCLPVDERDPVLAELEKNKGSKLAKENFKIGMIIRAPLHEEDYSRGRGVADTDATVADKFRTDSKFGAIFTKYRHMIVIALYQDHYVAVPLYTHNGKGLEHKVKADEFVSVQDHRVPGEFKKLSIHQPIVTETMNAGVRYIDPKSTAHYTYPVSRKYGLPVVAEGQVKKVCLTSLTALVNNAANKAGK